MENIRFAALGDSFTEGVGDELDNGYVRGWADLFAEGVALSTGEPVQYANFAIRGKLLGQVIAEQLESAIKLQPTLVSFAAGGNDVLRPKVELDALMKQAEHALHQILYAGAQPFLLSGGNPSKWLPMTDHIQSRGDALIEASSALAEKLGLEYVNNWNYPELQKRKYWAEDRLHLNAAGHRLIAARVLQHFGYQIPNDWVLTAEDVRPPSRLENAQFAVKHVAPWIKRRLTGRSSGDGREAKYSTWVTITPQN